MLDVYLYLCYDSIFDGMTHAYWRTMERLIDAHEATEPRIETLEDFVTEFVRVMGLFGRLTFPAAPARLTREGVRGALAAMRQTILTLDVAGVCLAIDGYVRNFGRDEAHPERVRGVMEGHLRAFLCHAHHVEVMTPVHGGAEATVEHLLRRMQLLRECV